MFQKLQFVLASYGSLFPDPMVCMVHGVFGAGGGACVWVKTSVETFVYVIRYL